MDGETGGVDAGPAADVRRERLEEHVRTLAGERHPRRSPQAHRRARLYIEERFREAGLDPLRESFSFRKGRHDNVVARKEGVDGRRPRVLIGAHYDTVPGSPGADDNGSGLALLLEAARVLAQESLRATVEFVAFDLEEFQGWTYRVGSRRYVAQQKDRGVEYAGAFVLEMVGYTDPSPGSQRIPAVLRWMGFPDTGDFLAAIGDGKSASLLSHYREAQESAAPDLPLVTFRSPLRGWLVWNTRRSDNASFWSGGIPALMLTDTAFLRNPNYHKATDTPDTLDFHFLEQVTRATVEAVRRLAGPVGSDAGTREPEE